jgi:hypothetical protein
LAKVEIVDQSRDIVPKSFEAELTIIVAGVTVAL